MLVKNKRPIKRIIDLFKGKIIIKWHGSTWMDDVSTEDYLRRVIGKRPIFGGNRLLVWDAFASHKSASTTAVLKELNVDVAFIPGGCTKFIQVGFFRVGSFDRLTFQTLYALFRHPT